jgi:replicative DNA helicase
MTTDDLKDPWSLASDQLTSAGAVRGRDYAHCPRWRWPDLHRLLGPMVPGNLIVLAAGIGQGKSTLQLSQLDDMARKGVGVLYVPLEIDPEQARRQWACLRVGLPWEIVALNKWADLPRGAQEEFDAVLWDQLAEPVQFLPGRRCTFEQIRAGVQWAVESFGATTVMLDHIHRLAISGGHDARVQWTDLGRALKDLAREYQVALIAAAQLNRSGNDVLDRYTAPHLDRIKETSAIAEEADVVLVLSRALRADAKINLKDIRLGRQTLRDLEEPNVMRVTCRKHRLLDAARDRTVRLWCERGFVCDLGSEDDPR